MNNKIFFLSSEIAPFSETYYVSEFTKRFCSYMHLQPDTDIRLNQPKFGYISERKYILREVIRLKDMSLDFNGEENLVNLLLPLAVRVKFEHKNLRDLDKIRKTFNKISIIDSYTFEDFNINNSFFKIYYFGNPKKLKSELFKFGYLLKSDQGFWQIYLND